MPTTAGLRLRELLRDQARPGAPEPTLLPWLARRTVLAGQGGAAIPAASSSRIAAGDGRWPVVADAVAAVIAARTLDPGMLTVLINILPPVAGHLGEGQSRLVPWSAVRPDALLYAALGGHGSAVGAETLARALSGLAPRPAWDVAFGGRSAAREFPALADLGSLDWLISRGTSDDPAGSAEQAVYLLPFRFAGASVRGQAAQRRQAIEAITRALAENRYWYGGALLARAAPFLGAEGRARLRPVIAELPGPWAAHLAGLAGSWGPRWESDEAELAASHPAIARLTELADAVDTAELADICQAEISDITSRHGLSGGWVNAVGWDRFRQTDREAQHYRRLPDTFYRDLQHLLNIPEATPETAAPETAVPEAGESEPARFVNVYVAEAGHDDPVPDLPLTPGAAYEVCCNIGPVDTRSLLDRDSSVFPEELLPDGPATLRAVLFVEGRKAADATMELPATGATEWVRLRLPAVPAPGVVHAELAIYYEIAVVMVCELTIPVGGAQGPGPKASLRYRLSRSLKNLKRQLAGRNMSVLVPGTVAGIYVNGLDYAPQEFSYSPATIKQAAETARWDMYFAHFEVTERRKKVGEVNRYTESSDGGYEKPMADLIADMRTLARSGAAVYGQLFGGVTLPWRVRAEAEAFGRPPILQVVTLGQELLSIPWACVYDLNLSDDPSEYEPCPAIAEFGPGGKGGDPPARCPYEAGHKRINQLCPWGFWGLSVIIEHPPSTETRDLEVSAGSRSGAPSIVVAYDTSLDPALCAAHVGALRTEYGTALLEPQLKSRADVGRALEATQMDVLYFYCHVKDDPSRPGQHVPVIGLGADQVSGGDITGWGRDYWDRDDTEERHPLVVLNGCHSVEAGPDSLYNLVRPFVTWVQACGLIGTEVTIEQGLGAWAMELFLAELRRQPVGMALRSTRWKMFGRGNMMGLGYTPYCLAGLTLG